MSICLAMSQADAIAKAGHGAKEINEMMIKCLICDSEKREVIDQALKEEITLREISQRFGFTKSTIHRHFKYHGTSHLRYVRQLTEGQRRVICEMLDNDMEEVLRLVEGYIRKNQSLIRELMISDVIKD